MYGGDTYGGVGGGGGDGGGGFWYGGGGIGVSLNGGDGAHVRRAEKIIRDVYPRGLASVAPHRTLNSLVGVENDTIAAAACCTSVKSSNPEKLLGLGYEWLQPAPGQLSGGKTQFVSESHDWNVFDPTWITFVSGVRTLNDEKPSTYTSSRLLSSRSSNTKSKLGSVIGACVAELTNLNFRFTYVPEMSAIMPS